MSGTRDAFVHYDGAHVHDRSDKVAKRQGRMKLNGRSLKRLLNDRAMKAQHTAKGTPSHGK